MNFAMIAAMTGGGDGEDMPRITVVGDTGDGGAAEVAACLAAEISAGFGKRDERPLSLVAQAGEAVAGGLNGSMHWGWCYIRQLWVQPGWRRRGLGRRLLDGAEKEARARGCVGVYVDTFDAGAAMFYERAGFELFGRIDGFPPGHTRFFLQKTLARG